MAQQGEPELDYLCVDAFMADAVGARALASAFETGLIDALTGQAPRMKTELAQHLRLDPRGLSLLLDMLLATGVVERAGGAVALSAGFSAALPYRDLMLAKLEFCSLAAPDFFERFTLLLASPAQFFAQAKLFELFSYDRCFESTAENVAATSRWVGITTALTRYEAPVVLRHHDFSQHKRMLDVGGNSGEFALQVCRRHAHIQAAVFDLPLVCELGARHVGGAPEAARISFIEAAAESPALPAGFDLVCFKSMLHDWPDAQTDAFLAKAWQALEPGGTVLIFERGTFEPGEARIPYSLIPVVLFFRSYRPAEDYAGRLQRAGFRDVQVIMLMLEMPFILVSARK
jgi:ubiquinone/menaquinone biosynthesis C-methylase UbiE